MIDSSWSEFWWNNITGAKMLVDNVAKALLTKTIVVLKVPDDLPWRHQMRTAIQSLVRNKVISENTLVEMIDVADDCAGQEPGRYLLQQYGQSQEIRRGYRSASSKTIQQYLLNNKVLQDLIIWVKGVPEEEVKKWIDFCKDYAPTNITDGAIILELKDSPVLKSSSFVIVNYEVYVSDYDVQLFASIILDQMQKYSNSWKKYISALVASLCEGDAEISTQLLQTIDFTKDAPIKGLEMIDDSHDFDSRGSGSGSNHILSLYRKQDNVEIQKRIWRAQVQTLFPIIELERRKFIEQYYTDIQTTLKELDIVQNKETITDPWEVEIGTLWYLMDNKRIYMKSDGECERLSALRRYRNTIAHIQCLTPNEICDLLST